MRVCVYVHLHRNVSSVHREEERKAREDAKIKWEEKRKGKKRKKARARV